MADLKISQLQDTTTASTSDVFPFTQFGITKKINFGNLNNALPLYTFVRSNSASWLGSGGGLVDSAEFQINGSSGLFNTYNSTEYIVPWNAVSYQTNSSVIEADNTLNNMIIKQTGLYLIDIRYASYDLNTPTTATLRLTLRGQFTIPITTTVGGSLIETIGDGIVGTSLNGYAQKRGTLLLRVNTVPYYIVATFVHTGGTAALINPTGTGAYPVFENSTGTEPYFTVIKVS
jgi:hypothetical protein